MYLRTSFGPSIYFHENRYHLKEFIAFKNVPKNVQQRILTFYDYFFNNKFFRRNYIKNVVFGSEMRNMIAVETCVGALKENYLFKNLPENLIISIALVLVEVIYLENDVIIRNDRHRGEVKTNFLYDFTSTYL